MFRVNRCIVGLSRRQADVAITNGRVLVNGKSAEVGQLLNTGDRLVVDGEPVVWESLMVGALLGTAKGDSQAKNELLALNRPLFQSGGGRVYLKMWKPTGLVTTTSNEQGLNIFSVPGLKEKYPTTRLFPVGRLDKESSGLLLLTSHASFQELLLGTRFDTATLDTENDTDKARLQRAELFKREKAGQPQGFEKVYELELSERPSNEALDAWRNGLSISIPNDKRKSGFLTVKTKPAEVELLKTNSDGTSSVQFTLRQGLNRQLRRMAAAFNLNVNSLHRTQFCGVTLSGLNQPGDFKELTDEELKYLSDLVKNRILEEDKRDMKFKPSMKSMEKIKSTMEFAASTQRPARFIDVDTEDEIEAHRAIAETQEKAKSWSPPRQYSSFNTTKQFSSPYNSFMKAEERPSREYSSRKEAYTTPSNKNKKNASPVKSYGLEDAMFTPITDREISDDDENSPTGIEKYQPHHDEYKSTQRQFPSHERRNNDSGERRFNNRGDGERRFNDRGDGERRFNDRGDGERRFNHRGDGERRFNDRGDGERRSNNLRDQ